MLYISFYLWTFFIKCALIKKKYFFMAFCIFFFIFRRKPAGSPRKKPRRRCPCKKMQYNRSKAASSRKESMEMPDLMLQIESAYDKLTPAARKVADYLRSHCDEAQYLSITELAQACEVAEATVFRFCRALGFSGYNDLKLALARHSLLSAANPYQAYSETSKEDTVEAMCRQLYNTNIEALTQTLNLLDEKTLCRAVDIFVKAGRVMCFGYGGSMPVAQKAWTRFLTVSPKFFTIQDTHMQIMASSLLDKDDALLMVSYSGSPEETESVLQPARQRGAKVVLITHDPHSPAARLSDAVLLCGGNEKPLRAGSIAAHMAMLFVVDMLVNEFCRRDMETTMQNKDRVTQALSSRHQ